MLGSHQILAQSPLIVIRAFGPTISALTTVAPKSAGCVPTKAIPVQVGLLHNYQVSAGWLVGLAIRMVDDCGSPINQLQVNETFSNGDPPVLLTPADGVSGLYWGTWTPRSVSPQVNVIATVAGTDLPLVTVKTIGQVMANNAPIIATNGVSHIFNPAVGGALAPGAAIQIYGNNLASATAAATSAPLPKSLGGTKVLIGGMEAPLYYASPGQINAQAPFELGTDKEYEVCIEASGG